MAQSKKPTLVVLAAGMGSRFGGLKQIEPVGPAGEIVIEYTVFDALRAGFGRVVFVIRSAIEADFRAVVEQRLAGRLGIDYVFQELDDVPPGATVSPGRTKPWGTAHAVLACRSAIDGPFAVVNADDFYGRAAFAELATALGGGESMSPPTFVLVAYALARTLSDHGPVSRGICEVDADGHLVRVDERLRIERADDIDRDGFGNHGAARCRDGAARYRDGDVWHPLAGDTPTSMNLWGFTPDIFDPLGAAFALFLAEHGSDPAAEMHLPAAVDAFVRAGLARVHVLRTDAPWFGVTYPADMPGVATGLRDLVAAGEYPSPLWGLGTPGGAEVTCS